MRSERYFKKIFDRPNMLGTSSKLVYLLRSFDKNLRRFRIEAEI